MFKFNNKDTRTTDIVLVSSWLTLNIFHILSQCFYCQLCASKCCLDKLRPILNPSFILISLKKILVRNVWAMLENVLSDFSQVEPYKNS